MRPSSVPAHTIPSRIGDGAIVYTTPQPCAAASAMVGCPVSGWAAATPPVRSGLASDQCNPPSVVRSTFCAPKYSVRLSIGSKTMGDVQVNRYFRTGVGSPNDPSGHGAMSCIWLVLRSKRVSAPYGPPPYTILAAVSIGSIAIYPPSAAPTVYQSLSVISP